MIDNSNSSQKVFYDSPEPAIGCGQNGVVSMSEVIADLRERKENVLSGSINCIPLPFVRFRSEFPGFEQEQYIVLTASTKAGKSQLSSFLLYNVLDYAFNHPDQCSIHIIYFNLEESQMRIKQRYISYLLYKLDGHRLSPRDLRSTSADYPLPDDILDLLDTQKYKERLDFFDQCVQFETEDTNPTGILRTCEEYAKKVGDYKTIKKKSRGSDREVEVFQSYTPHDKKHYKFVLLDHIGLVDLERGMSLKQSMDKVSEYAVKYLRNRYKYNVIAIQQQATEAEGLEAIKQKKMVPAVATLGDTKYTARDANYTLGLFDPSFFGLPSWLGYKIQDTEGIGLKSYGRFLYILRGRDGESGGVCPLFFDGAVCYFEELPKPENVNELDKYYDKVKNIKSFRQQQMLKRFTATIFVLIRKFLKNDEPRQRTRRAGEESKGVQLHRT